MSTISCNYISNLRTANYAFVVTKFHCSWIKSTKRGSDLAIYMFFLFIRNYNTCMTIGDHPIVYLLSEKLPIRSACNQTFPKCIFREPIESGCILWRCFTNWQFQLGLDKSSITLFCAFRACRIQFPVISFSRIFNKCSSTKMKAPSFRQISVILRIVIDDHKRQRLSIKHL